MATVYSISKKPKLFDYPKDRDDLVYLAVLAASGGRYEHMYGYMRRLAEILGPTERLTVEERKCFSWACNSYIKNKQDAYRSVAKLAADWAGIDQKQADAANAYLPMMAREIDAICRDVVKTINKYFMDPVYGRVRSALAVEPMIFYRTLKGDFLRYQAEVNTGFESQRFADEAYKSYLSAKRDEGQLPTTNPTRLDMRFSLAHLICDVFRKPYEGYKIAGEAYELAMRDLKAAGEEPSGDIADALSRLQHFLNLWKNYAT
ncbi:14-3-3 protein 2-like [Phalaenopsis equestris]|uniref:14-3-3 protein 2-like n=1 Tax=Phalaenopsis equestris TaxID=78828 RepID=UPI0009E64F6D|nr:14-3-3 protein 2-like [Phalaenopsis equestris]